MAIDALPGDSEPEVLILLHCIWEVNAHFTLSFLQINIE